MQDYFAKLAQVESGGNPLARNPNSSAKGMFQFVDSTAKQYGITAPFGTPEYAKQEIEAVQKFTMDNKAQLAKALGREPTQGELYLAHQQGAGGAAKILTNPSARAIDLVGNEAITLNAGDPNMTAGEFAQQWTGKFGDAPQEPEKIEQETFTIVLPDGTELDGIPVGTTKEQIKAKLAAGGYDVSKLEGGEPKQETQEAPEKPQAGFVQRTGEAYDRRLGNVGKSFQAYDDQTLGETVAQVAGQGFGAVGDVLGNALISGYRYLPDTDYGLGEGAALLGSIPTGEDRTLTDSALGGLRYVMEKGREFAAENPRAARNLAAAGNIGAALLPLKGANLAGKAGVATGKTIKNTAQVLDKLIPKVENVTAASLGKAVNQGYEVAKQLGGSLTQTYTKDLSKRIISKIDEAGASLPAQSQKILRGMSDPEGVVRQGVELVKSLDGKPLDLAGFEAIDKTLTGLRYGSGTSEPAALKLGIVQRELRSLVDNAKPSDIAGGIEGFEAYRKATALASKKFRINELEQMTANAFATQQPVNALKGRLSKFLANKDNLRGFSKEEIALITKASETGVLTEMIRGVTGRLPAIATLATNPALAPAVSAGSTAARKLSTRAMAKRMQEINNLIATGQAGKQSLLNAGAQNTVNVLGKSGELIEKAYQGNRGNLATLGTLQQLQREAERNQQ
jgi:hypothetical protein